MLITRLTPRFGYGVVDVNKAYGAKTLRDVDNAMQYQIARPLRHFLEENNFSLTSDETIWFYRHVENSMFKPTATYLQGSSTGIRDIPNNGDDTDIPFITSSQTIKDKIWRWFTPKEMTENSPNNIVIVLQSTLNKVSESVALAGKARRLDDLLKRFFTLKETHPARQDQQDSPMRLVDDGVPAWTVVPFDQLHKDGNNWWAL